MSVIISLITTQVLLNTRLPTQGNRPLSNAVSPILFAFKLFQGRSKNGQSPESLKEKKKGRKTCLAFCAKLKHTGGVKAASSIYWVIP